MHRNYKNPSKLCQGEIVHKSLVECTTLDLWLQRYKDYGFLALIDFMWCNFTAEKMGFLLDSIIRASKTANLDALELRHALSSL